MVKVLLIDNLILKTYLADVSIGCSNPPQGEMNLDWMGLYFYRLPERAKYSKIISFGLCACLTGRPVRSGGRRGRCSSWPHLSISCTWRSNSRAARTRCLGWSAYSPVSCVCSAIPWGSAPWPCSPVVKSSSRPSLLGDRSSLGYGWLVYVVPHACVLMLFDSCS